MDKQLIAVDDKIISVSDVYYLCRGTTAKEAVWMTSEDSQVPRCNK